eukprot:CAMPEP_0113473212 /NCGR_PEP_ID=MMETSP0014_2-20120614/17926_1 /TAXON_ID=2857 /ORGANISM="Nitzschia sp." /LENGTH=254 /DNA_ID=CAMNT_0000365969 /DNA_START=599 /DNA_END=1360 /DNA_ORIENTATION=+ /assembly_acc=CAM_ASM_000159
MATMDESDGERTSSGSTTTVSAEAAETIATITTTTTSTTTDLEMGLISSRHNNRNQSASSDSSDSSPSPSPSSSSSSMITAPSSATADDFAPVLQKEPTAHYVSIYLEHQQQQMEAGRREIQSLKDEITSLRRDLRWRSSVRHQPPVPVAVAAPPARPQQQQQNNDGNNNNNIGGGGGAPEQQKCIKFCCDGINLEYLVKGSACFCFLFYLFWVVGMLLPDDNDGQYIPSECHEYIEKLVDDDDWNTGDSDGIS